MLESTTLLRSTKLNRAHESEIIQQHRQENNGDIAPDQTALPERAGQR